MPCDDFLLSQQSHRPREPRKKAKPPLLMTEQEDDMVEWLKENHCLFNKKLNDYKNCEKKTRLWKENAEKIQVEVSMLKTWFKSMRTRYRKLNKSKSGNGASEHTERDR